MNDSDDGNQTFVPSAAFTAPIEGAVSWNMNTACNYRCSYCTQRFLDDRGRWARDIPRFLDGFARLPGEWEIKLSGGEPFVHPEFCSVVRGITKLGLHVSVVTNFSASAEKLEAFLDAAGDRLRVFSASLHLEYVHDEESGHSRDSLERFVSRCRFVIDRLPRGASFCVTCVATRQNLSRLWLLKERFDEAGIRFKVQPEKQNRDVISYEPHETEQLIKLGGHNQTGRIAADFSGRPCYAGHRYFILDDQGRAYRCYPARRYKKEYLGNFLEPTFSLTEGARTCSFTYCNCTVPIERGMMPTDDARDAALRTTRLRVLSEGSV